MIDVVSAGGFDGGSFLGDAIVVWVAAPDWVLGVEAFWAGLGEPVEQCSGGPLVGQWSLVVDECGQ